MATFKDREKTSWVLDINTTVLKRARSEGFDIPKGIADGSLLETCIQDEIYLVDLIYILCKPQAESRKITDEQFGELVGTGPVIKEAVTALMEALTDFYQDRAGPVMAAMEKYQEMESKVLAEANDKIANMDVEALVKKFGKSLTNALASAGSTQAH